MASRDVPSAPSPVSPRTLTSSEASPARHARSSAARCALDRLKLVACEALNTLSLCRPPPLPSRRVSRAPRSLQGPGGCCSLPQRAQLSSCSSSAPHRPCRAPRLAACLVRPCCTQLGTHCSSHTLSRCRPEGPRRKRLVHVHAARGQVRRPRRGLDGDPQVQL